MRKILLTFAVLSAAFAATAQCWNIESDRKGCLLGTCCNADNETILVGRYDKDSFSAHATAFAIKIDEDGSYTTFQADDDDYSSFFEVVALDDGGCFVVGVRGEGVNERLWVLKFDEDLEVVSEHFYDKDAEFAELEFCCMLMTKDNDSTFLVTGYVGFGRYIGYFYRLNANGECLNSKYIHLGDYDGLFDYHMYWPDCIREMHECSDFLVIGAGQGGNPSFLRFDYDFNLVSTNIINDLPNPNHGSVNEEVTLLTFLYSDYWIDSTNLLISGYAGEDTDDNLFIDKHYMFFGKADINANIYETVFVANQDTLHSTIQYHNMSVANDTTIYIVTEANVGSYLGPSVVDIYLANKDLELLGRLLPDNVSTGYTPVTAVATKDGGIVVAESQPWDDGMRIRKFLRDDFRSILSVSEESDLLHECLVYPNPAVDAVHIDVSGLDVGDGRTVFRVFDVLGRQCFNRTISGDGSVLTLDVSFLKSGTYSFQVIRDKEVLVSDKFIKL
ncbi:MAG: T9SS type A sorting domain-containing protein [Bacteroidales bacterium]|nr:T9SS type A sorting domain-containing protein [Bacteroidales bacterium]